MRHEDFIKTVNEKVAKHIKPKKAQGGIVGDIVTDIVQAGNQAFVEATMQEITELYNSDEEIGREVAEDVSAYLASTNDIADVIADVLFNELLAHGIIDI